jgi:glycosyltransferase involved in cell wall biosynthesis
VKVLVTAVGARTEHWTDLFAVLAGRPEVELTLALADVSAQTLSTLDQYGQDNPRLRYRVLPHRLSEARTGHMASVLFRPRALRELAPLRPDIVHIIGEAAYLTTWQATRLRARHWPGAPLTLYAAQNVVMRFPPPFPRLEKRAYAAVDHAFPITPSALDVLRTKGYSGPATIVPLGVDTGRFRPAAGPWPGLVPGPSRTRRRFTVGFVGRLEPHKGILGLLTAAERIDCDVLVVGRGSLSAAVAGAADRRPGRITVRDWADHDELPGLLARMDVLALPSVEVMQRNVLPFIGIPLREQFGRVLVEAMACGIPVVGSDVGEIPHVVGAAGLIFPAGNVPALTDRLALIRDDPTLAHRLGGQGIRRAASEFSWERVATSMYDVWQSLCFTGLPNPGKVSTT